MSGADGNTPPVPETSVALVEDDPRLRAALRGLLAETPGFRVAWEADSVAGAIALLSAPLDLLIVDLGLIGGSGIEVIRAARAEPRLATLRILVLTLFSDEERVLAALGEGADGYLLKDADEDRLLADIRATMAGEAPISAGAATHLLRRFRALPTAAGQRAEAVEMPLTPREAELLQALAKGLSYREIATLLAISVHTVRDHVKNIYRKLGVNSRGEAVFEALANGMVKL